MNCKGWLLVHNRILPSLAPHHTQPPQKNKPSSSTHSVCRDIRKYTKYTKQVINKELNSQSVQGDKKHQKEVIKKEENLEPYTNQKMH